jgi:mRNA interferase MazF
MSAYTPGRGDIVWLSFSPQTGHEQAGRRPGLVLSPMKYNGRVGLMLACPITSKAKGYPFEVGIPEGVGVSGVILSDQLRSVDWKERGAEFAGRLDPRTLDEVYSKLDAVLHDEG